MAKKLRFYYVWDLRSILWTAGVLFGTGLLFLGFLFFPDISARYQLSKFDAQTHGNIIAIDEQTGIRHSKEGSTVSVFHYIVTYSYIVDGQTLTGIDYISGTSKNHLRLKKIHDLKQRLIIHYMRDRPTKSMIDIVSID